MPLVQGLFREDPGLREFAADQITDVISSLTSSEIAALATLLSAIAATESNFAALESELHAILELASAGAVSRDQIAHLGEIDIRNISPEHREYIADLLAE